MRILVEFSETKREIDGSFSVCGSKDDLLSVARQILETAERGFTYGWVSIYADLPKKLMDTPAQPWDTAAGIRKAHSMPAVKEE